jgi:hypothetical protein
VKFLVLIISSMFVVVNFCSQELLNAVEHERALRRHKIQAAQIYHRSPVEEYEFDRVSVSLDYTIYFNCSIFIIKKVRECLKPCNCVSTNLKIYVLSMFIVFANMLKDYFCSKDWQYKFL